MRWNRRNGMHWQEASNPRLRQLAEERAWEVAMPHEEESGEFDGTIEVYFGSTSAELSLRDINGAAESIFGFGYCVLLAWAIHERTGLPLALFTSGNKEDGWSGHAAIQLDEETFLDITGKTTAASIQRRYSGTAAAQIVSPEEFLTITFDEEHRSDPLGFLGELERLVTEDFAEHIVELHGVKTLVVA